MRSVEKRLLETYIGVALDIESRVQLYMLSLYINSDFRDDVHSILHKMMRYFGPLTRLSSALMLRCC